MSAEETENKPEVVPAEEPSSKESHEQKLQQEMLYLRAEFENSKKRLLRDQEASIRFANEKIIGDLLSVVDLFERGLTTANSLKESGSEEVKSFVTGIEMTHRELVHLLQRFGVELVGVEGEKFDPNKHEAISQLPVEAAHVDNVVSVVQRGGALQGRLLKPARVVVGIPK